MTIDDARIVALTTIADERGALTVAEAGRHVPFPIRRVFVLHRFAAGAARGGHAHRKLEEMISAPAGRFRVRLDDARGKVRDFLLASPEDALYVPAMAWVELFDFSADAVALVFASDVYDEGDYLRERAAFEREARAGA